MHSQLNVVLKDFYVSKRMNGTRDESVAAKGMKI